MAMRFSPTGIDTVLDCPRKGAFKYDPDTPQPPPGPGAALGSEGHGLYEDYVREGKAPPSDTHAGQLVRAGLKYAPKPRTGKVEDHFEVRIGSLVFHGYLDWQGPAKDVGNCDTDLPVNVDYKFQKTPKKYGIWVGGEKEPQDDTQACVYAAYRMISEGTDSVFNRWLYHRTDTKKATAEPSDFVLTRSQVARTFEDKIYPGAHLLHQIRLQKPDPNTVPAKAQSCGKYGGCPYAEVRGGPCRLTNEEKMAGMAAEGGLTMAGPAFLQSLKAQQTQAAPAQAPAQAAPAQGFAQAVNPPAQAAAPVQAPAQAAPAAQPAPVQGQAAAPAPAQPSANDRANREALAGRIGFAVLDVVDYGVALLRGSK